MTPRSPPPRRAGAGFPPIRKSLGQHFLNDRRILQRIVGALDLSTGETVIEVGPGRGSLTDVLVPAAGQLIVIEYDRALAARLRERYASVPHVRVIEADVLTVNLAEVAEGPYALVGNVPYYITTPILFHALEPPMPTRAVYLVQREVADRLVAAPNSDDYGALSVNVQAVCAAKQLFRVAPGSFEPPPKVESAVVRLDPRKDPAISPSEATLYRRFVVDAFGMRRKQMRRVLRMLWSLSAVAAETILETAGLDPTTRPEALSPADFAQLMRLRNQVGQSD